MPTKSAVTFEVGKLIAARYPKGPESAGELDGCIAMWLDDLDDLTDADLAAACRAYRRSVEPADRWFPTPGRILALSPVGRAMAALGSDEDSARALTDFVARMRALGFRPSRDAAARHLDPVDPYRNDAMFQALADFGGATAWGMRNVEDPYRVREAESRWMASYRAARLRQVHDREAVRFAACRLASSPRLLAAPVGET